MNERYRPRCGRDPPLCHRGALLGAALVILLVNSWYHGSAVAQELELGHPPVISSPLREGPTSLPPRCLTWGCSGNFAGELLVPRFGGSAELERGHERAVSSPLREGATSLPPRCLAWGCSGNFAGELLVPRVGGSAGTGARA